MALRKKDHKPDQWDTPEQRLLGCEMPLHVQKLVEKMQEDLIAFYLVKRKKFADKVGLPESDPIRFGIRETFCCRCGHFWMKRTSTPKKCPLCRSKHWATPRENRQGLRPGS